MSKIIGQKERFAIEYDLYPPGDATQKYWLYGHICFWLAGQMVGRRDEVAALTVALASFSALSKAHGARHEPRLLALPATEAFLEIYSALYVDTGQSDEEVARASERYAKLESVPGNLDVFDGWLGFLVEDEDRGRYLWRDANDKVHEAWLRAGEFDEVLEAFLRDLEREAQQTRDGGGRRSPV